MTKVRDYPARPGGMASAKKVNAGRPDYTLQANLLIANRKVHCWQIAVLPDGSQFYRVDARRNSGCGWIRIEDNTHA